MTHKADSCKEIKSREKYTAEPLTAGGYMSGYRCLLSGKGGETPMSRKLFMTSVAITVLLRFLLHRIILTRT